MLRIGCHLSSSKGYRAMAKDAKKIIDNISDKRKQNVKVVIGNRAEVCDAILYIIKSNYGLIVSVDDAEEIKFCEELFEKVTT